MIRVNNRDQLGISALALGAMLALALLALALVALTGCAMSGAHARPPLAPPAAPAMAAPSAVPAPAATPLQEEGAPVAAAARRPPMLFKGGIGFTADPGQFLIGAELDFFLNENFSIGPLLQFGVEDGGVILAPSANFVYHFYLEDPLERLRPFVQGGVGFAYLHEDDRKGDDDDIGVMINIGGGINYEIADRTLLGSHMLFNAMPDKVLDENFFFSWQVVTIGWEF